MSSFGKRFQRREVREAAWSRIAEVSWKIWAPCFVAVALPVFVLAGVHAGWSPLASDTDDDVAAALQDWVNEPCAWTAHNWVDAHYSIAYENEHDGKLPDPDISMANGDNACNVTKNDGEHATINMVVAQGVDRWTVDLGLTRLRTKSFGIRNWSVTSFYEHPDRSIAAQP
jgi:hypothetical protein